MKESVGEAKRDTVEEGVDLALWAFGVQQRHYRAPKDLTVPPSVNSDTYESWGLSDENMWLAANLTVQT